ncbi:ROK family transcriptional regulator [Streptomyces sp. NBC_00378]|uniref:ROK family transcriptional regulator n=1 Tax=unclassified Streptomyces TaxID=2593676 RepID=UPI002254EDA9|nr:MULTISPECIES: ROK family transcriptional regulator [unclassified Streptomyces]MCX5107290.1 ROK family transcriptional regulator [Streptomyces sp. NBC_00378]
MADPFLPPTDPRRRAERGLARVSARRRPPERTKASTLDSRIHNRALVLATLYHQGAMSRSEIARTLRLTAPTVSALIAELEGDGLVVDTGPRKGSRLGKPASVMRIDDDAAHILTVDLSGSEYFSGAVLNLRGDVVQRARVRYGDILGERAIELVFQLVGELMDLAPRRILGIGVGSPGIVGDAGVIHHAAHLGWSELPLAAQLAERFGVPAYVGNDVNIAALAVLHFRNAKTQNLMVITIEHGVGAGLIVGGELVEGEQFAAGEIGHVTVDEDGDPCICGHRGCLEPLIDAAELRMRLAGRDPSEHDAVLADAGRALGSVLAPISSVLNLNEIALLGPPDLVEGSFLDAAAAVIRARTYAPISASLTMRSFAGDSDLILLGGASIVLAGELGVW